MYKDGQIITDHKAFANWTNANGNKFYDESNGDGTYTVHKFVIPEPTHEDIAQIRASEYQAKVDPITAHISRLRDKEQTEEVIAEIAELISERDALVEQIKAEHPYPEEQEQEQTEEKEEK